MQNKIKIEIQNENEEINEIGRNRKTNIIKRKIREERNIRKTESIMANKVKQEERTKNV